MATMSYQQIAVENRTNGRGYIEVRARSGLVELYAENTEQYVTVSMSIDEVCALIARLSDGLAAAL